RKACLVGLGRIGTAILDYEGFEEEGFEIAAGFDVSLNKIEMIVSRVNLYLIHELRPIIESRGIEIGIICTPPESAQDIANKLTDASIKGILNCTTAMISVPEEIILRNIDYTGYLRILSAHMSLKK
ncbi:MAG: CoA-binding protein, partial [Elusimicrobia bacterium]|nr:CoA-binding protein [Elusimicrobiota bacterium]